jgi:hypothetical protein
MFPCRRPYVELPFTDIAPHGPDGVEACRTGFRATFGRPRGTGRYDTPAGYVRVLEEETSEPGNVEAARPPTADHLSTQSPVLLDDL